MLAPAGERWCEVRNIGRRETAPNSVEDAESALECTQVAVPELGAWDISGLSDGEQFLIGVDAQHAGSSFCQLSGLITDSTSEVEHNRAGKWWKQIHDR